MTTRPLRPVLRGAVLACAVLSFHTIPAQAAYQLTPLPGIDPQSGQTYASDLSEGGRFIVGMTRPDPSGTPRPVIWVDGQMTFLPHAPNATGLNGAAIGINSAGTIVGSMPYVSDMVRTELYTHAVVWKGGALLDLGTSRCPGSTPIRSQAPC